MRKFNHNIFACLLCLTLLFAMGFGFEANKIHSDGTSSSQTADIDVKSKQQITNSNSSPILQPETEPIPSDPVKSNEPSFHPEPVIEEPHIDKLPAAEVTETNYEVTAYYLNVRAEADVTSRIINVVSKGSIVEVLKPTGNGWLELKSGGYIHGSYAKLITSESKPPALVKIASNEPASGEKNVVQAPQPNTAITSAEPAKPTSIVKSNSGLTEEHIAKIIKNTALEGEGLEEAILEIERTYGINSYFTIAVMKLESGHGKSQIAKTKNNLFGLNAIDRDAYNQALSFETKGDSVKKFGHIISEFYLDQGLTSVEKVAGKYCAANSNWPALVKSIMNSDYKKIL